MNASVLAAEDPSYAAEAMQIAREANAALVDRLRFAQAAWGGGARPMTAIELGHVVRGVSSRRVAVLLAGLDPGRTFGAGAVRLLLNVLLVACDALRYGGAVTLDGDPAGEVLVMLEGAGAAWPAGFGACLASPDVCWDTVARLSAADDSRGLQVPLTALIAQAEGLRISILMAPVAEAAAPLLLDFRVPLQPA